MTIKPISAQAHPTDNEQVKPFTRNDWLEKAREVLAIEAEAVNAQVTRLDAAFARACETILSTRGHVIVAGLGKSGHIGAKLAATFASTGTPAFYLHPAEAGHGDLGMVTGKDTLIALSYSGRAGEILTMIPIVRESGVPVLCITGNADSPMAQQADIHLHLHIAREACPLGLAPTSSSTATLALGDALAVSVMQARDFSSRDFARSHPFGRLGRRLTTKVADIMRSGPDLPRNRPEDVVQTALFQITDKRLGMTLVVDGETLIGIYTDGDLRRTLATHANALNLALAEVMTERPTTIAPDILAAEALQQMQRQRITVLPVLDNARLIGVVHIHDLLAAGLA